MQWFTVAIPASLLLSSYTQAVPTPPRLCVGINTMNHHVTSLMDHVTEFGQNFDLPSSDREALSSILDASQDFLKSRLQKRCSRLVNGVVVESGSEVNKRDDDDDDDDFDLGRSNGDDDDDDDDDDEDDDDDNDDAGDEFEEEHEKEYENENGGDKGNDGISIEI